MTSSELAPVTGTTPPELGADIAASPLPYDAGVEARTSHFAERLLPVIGAERWRQAAPYVDAILRLKRERGALILAHNYQVPELFHTVADLSGDSLALAQQAARSDAKLIVLCGVHFMAETAKLLNPEARVLIPDPQAGCSLADSIKPEDVRALRARYPGVPVVTYVNTSAAVKAECDLCCTSGNAVRVVESLRAERVVFLPDEYLGAYVAKRTRVELVRWHGHCEVHEKFNPALIASKRAEHPDAVFLAHPECPPAVLDAVDFVGSTAEMQRWVEQHPEPTEVVLVTEQSMGQNLAVLHPRRRFIDLAHPCPHMQLITLPKLYDCLRHDVHEVDVAPAVAEAARRSVERMLAV